MTRFLLRSLRRQLHESRTLFLLAVVGVALGVASVVAIQTLNQGAMKAFDGSVRAISGQAELTVTGTGPSFDEALLVRVLADREVTAAWPLCRVDVAVQGQPGLLLEVVGVDLLAPLSLPVAMTTQSPDVALDVVQALTTPGWMAVTPALASQQGWAVGDTVTVSSGSRTAALKLGALVDLQLREGADLETAAARLAVELGPGVRVQTPEQRSQDASGLLAAFRLNLTALSLISVFVGVFLVTTSVQASLSHRRREFGILRCLGARPRQVMGLILVETAALGVVGVLVGIPLGYLVALRNIKTVSATLTNIYVLAGIEKLVLPPEVIALAVGVGLGGALVGAVWPALDMARRDTLALLSPVTLHEKAGRSAGRLTWLALVLSIASTAWFALAGRGTPWGGFVYGALMMLALPMLVPLVVRLAASFLAPRGMGLSLSLRNLAARLHTTSFAVAALSVTVSMLVGITLLVGSFRQTLITWLDVTLRADVYVSTESWVRSGNEAFLDGEFLQELRDLPAVAAVEEQRRLRVRTSDGARLIWLNGIKVAGLPGTELATRLPLQSGDPWLVAAGLDRGEVLIGEPLARKEGLAIGDTLVLAGAKGPVAFRIAGVAFDYTSEGGTAFVTMPTLRRIFPDEQPNNAALFLKDQAAAPAVVAQLREHYAGRPLVFRSNVDLRREVLAVFDQTFAVTRTLQSLALVIAVLGVALNLLVQSRERVGELALLRSLGASRQQVFRLFLGEGAAMGALGLAMGLVGGVGLAALLILVVNRQWFGWTIQPAWPGLELARQAATVLLATVIAAGFPAFKAGLAGPEMLTKEE